MLGGQDGRPRSNATDDGEQQLWGCELPGWRRSGHRRVGPGLVHELDATGGAGAQLDHALAGERLEVVLCGVGRTKSKLTGNLSAGGRTTAVLYGLAYQIENLRLTSS